MGNVYRNHDGRGRVFGVWIAQLIVIFGTGTTEIQLSSFPADQTKKGARHPLPLVAPLAAAGPRGRSTSGRVRRCA